MVLFYSADLGAAHNGTARVLLKLELDCTPDAAWDALRSPAVFRSVAAPLLEFSSLEPDGFPGRWAAGQHPVSARALQLITFWHHTMAVSSLPDGRTLFRDRLRFEAWLATPFLWPALWAFWQWRGACIHRLAPTWG